MTSLALASLQSDDVMPGRIQLDGEEAVLRAWCFAIRTSDVQRGSIGAAAELAVGWVAGCGNQRQRLTGAIEDVYSRFVARPGGSIDVSDRVESHSVDSTVGTKVVQHPLAFERAVTFHLQRHQMPAPLRVVVRKIDGLAVG